MAVIIKITDLETAIYRPALAAIISFMLAIALTPIYTTLAYKHKWWKKARTTSVTGEKATVVHAQEAEKHERHFPTMAGIIILATVAMVTVGLNLSRSQTWLPLFAFLGAGVVGLIDDYLNVRGSKNLAGGLSARSKMGMITAIAAVGAFYFYYKLGFHLIHIPGVGDVSLGWLYIPLFIGVVVSTANAVNITDGLDGLSGGLLSIAFAAFGTIAALQHNFGIATFCVTVVGAMLAYTWFNIYPARFLMGDSGAFALGTALGVVAMLTNAVFVLPIIGGVFVAEGGSSALQLLSKRFLHRRIFIAAPVHHHFRALGWPETKVTQRFWVIGAILAASGIVVALSGGII